MEKTHTYIPFIK